MNKYRIKKVLLYLCNVQQYNFTNFFSFSSVVGMAPKKIEYNENHPLYKEKLCYIYRDGSVLLEGLQQALVLTNTIQVSDELPFKVDNLVENELLPNQDNLVKR